MQHETRSVRIQPADERHGFQGKTALRHHSISRLQIALHDDTLIRRQPHPDLARRILPFGRLHIDKVMPSIVCTAFDGTIMPSTASLVSSAASSMIPGRRNATGRSTTHHPHQPRHRIGHHQSS